MNLVRRFARARIYLSTLSYFSLHRQHNTVYWSVRAVKAGKAWNDSSREVGWTHPGSIHHAVAWLGLNILPLVHWQALDPVHNSPWSEFNGRPHLPYIHSMSLMSLVGLRILCQHNFEHNQQLLNRDIMLVCITLSKALISIRSRLTRNQLAFWMCWGHRRQQIVMWSVPMLLSFDSYNIFMSFGESLNFWCKNET